MTVRFETWGAARSAAFRSRSGRGANAVPGGAMCVAARRGSLAGRPDEGTSR